MNILVVDDSKIIRQTIKTFLKSEHIIYTAASAQEAIIVIDCQPVDLIIMNPLLTHNSGIELLYEIHSHADLRHIATIMVAPGYDCLLDYEATLSALNVKAIIPIANLTSQELTRQVDKLVPLGL